MKTALAFLAILVASLVYAGEKPPAGQVPDVVSGEVLEVKDVETYSYLRLKTTQGDTWAAVQKAPIKKGDKVTIENTMTMTNFNSKSLKRIFPKIVFGTLAGADSAVASNTPPGHAGMAQAPASADVKVAKATGANAYTVAEILTKGNALKDKPVVVRGKVVKYNPAIMGKNWLHLRDGTGAEGNDTNDLLVTTKSQAKVGDVVTAKGIVRTDKDFGAGYSYKLLIEDATLQMQ